MKRIRTVALAALVLVGVAACTPQQVAQHAPHRKATRPAVVTVDDGAPTGNLVPPQRLDVRIYADMSLPEDEPMVVAERRCEDMGGTVHWQSGTLLLCRGVDY